MLHELFSLDFELYISSLDVNIYSVFGSVVDFILCVQAEDVNFVTMGI